MRAAEEFEKLLNSFPSIEEKKAISVRLSSLPQNNQDDTLYIVLENILHFDIKDEITDNLLNIILNYLDSKKDAQRDVQSDALFSALSNDTLTSLYPLTECLMNLYEADQEKFVSIFEVIAQKKLNAMWISIETFKLILRLDSSYFTERGTQLLNKLAEYDYKKIITFLNLLHNEPQSLSLEELINAQDNQRIPNYLSIMDKLDCEKIRPKTINDWNILITIDLQWFDTKNYKTKKYRDSLDKKIFSLFGYKYLLTKIPLKYCDEKLIFVINFLIKVYITDETKEFEWAALSYFFQIDLVQLPVLIANFEKVVKKIKFETVDDDKRKSIKKIHTVLLMKENRVDKEGGIDKIIMLSKLHEKIYSRDGMKLLTKIQNFKIEMTESYIKILNEIIGKPQLPYIKPIKHLTNEWLTEAGLKKLTLFSEKYLSTEGIKFIIRLNVNSVTEKMIKEINDSNHSDLIHYFGDVTDEHLSFEKVLSIRIKRTKLISAFVEKLKTQPSRRDANTSFLLTGECFYTQSPLISSESGSDDPPILYINPKRTTSITIEELNTKLCVIYSAEGGCDLIASREHAQLHAFSNTNHPHQNRPFTNADIKKLDEININIDTVNKKFNLFQKESNEIDLTMSRSIQGLRCEELLRPTTLLEKLPEIFFSDENIVFLLSLDSRYFKNELILKFLSRYIVDEVNDEKIIFLNKFVEEIFALLEKSNLPMIELVDKLPKFFFQDQNILCLNNFDSKFFSDTPLLPESPSGLEYLNAVLTSSKAGEIIPKLNKLMQIHFFPVLTTEVFHNLQIADFNDQKTLMSKLHKLACEDWNFVLEFFKKNTVNFFQQFEFIDILKAHMERDDFIELIYVASKYITEHFCNNLTMDDTALCQKLFIIAHYPKNNSKDSIFPGKIFRILQILNKKLIINDLKLSMPKSLLALVEFHNSMFNFFKERLKYYEEHRLRRDKDGNLTTKWTRTAKIRLIAFNKLNKLVESNRPIPEIFQMINLEASNIGLYDSPHFFKGLQTYCTELYERIETLKFYFIDALTDCKNDQTGKNLAICLLDEVFYSMLETKNFIDLSAAKSDTFFDIMERYRPADLYQLLQLATLSPDYSFIKKRHDLYAAKQTSKNRQTSKSEKDKEDNFHTGLFSPFKEMQVTQKLNRIPTASAYQLQDIDITAGILILISEIVKALIKGLVISIVDSVVKENSNVHSHLEDLVLLPTGPIDQGAHIDKASTLKAIQDVAEKNRGKLCFGIMNVNGNHYFSIMIHIPVHGKCQILIIDPAFDTDDKQATISKIRNLLNSHFKNECEITVGNIIQQFNDSDCGIACLQTLHDIIHKKAIILVDGKIKLQLDKLTLDASKYIGNEHAFVVLAAKVRNFWKQQLTQLNKIYIIYSDGQKVPAGAYSYESNEALQSLKTQAQDFLDEILKKFLAQHTTKFQFDAESSIPSLDEAYYQEMIHKFIDNNDTCQSYFECLLKIKYIYDKFPSEKINFDEKTIEKKIIRQIRVLYRDCMCEVFNKQFVEFLKNEKYNLDFLQSEENCLEPYVEFVSKTSHAKWIEAFTNNEWDHYHHVKLYLKALKKEKSSMKNKMLSLFSQAVSSSKRETPLTSYNSTKSESKANKELEDSQRTEDLKQFLIEILNELLENLKNYPKIPLRRFLGKWHTSQLEALILVHRCNRFLHEIDTIDTLPEAKHMRLVVACTVYKTFHHSTNWYGKIRWDDISLGNLLKIPLAKLVGIAEPIIKKYDSPSEFEITKKVISDDSLFENHAFLYNVKIVKTGYEHLADLIKQKLYELKRSGIRSHSFYYDVG